MGTEAERKLAGSDAQARQPAVAARAAALPVKPRKPKAGKPKKPKRNKRPPRAVRLSQAERQFRRAHPGRIGISVTVSMPRMRVPARMKSRMPPFMRRLPPWLLAPFRRYRRVAIAALALMIIAAAGLHFGHHRPQAGPAAAAAAERTQPDFQPLLPSAAEAGSRSYDGKRDLVSYATTFSGARLTVSQQPLPANFQTDPQALQKAADSIQANQRIDTARGPVFIATGAQKDQLAVFADKHVLLFIHTDSTLNSVSWKSFIELLQAKE